MIKKGSAEQTLIKNCHVNLILFETEIGRIKFSKAEQKHTHISKMNKKCINFTCNSYAY